MTVSNQTSFDKIRPFVFGGMAGITATCVIQPIDMVKVQIQLQGETVSAGSGKVQISSKNPLVLGRYIVQQKGISALYRGLDSAITRQAIYTTLRMGLFRTFSDKLTVPGEKLKFWKRCVCSLSAGGVSALIATPADVCLIRMQADATLPEASRRNYKNVADAMRRMYFEEGVAAQYKGATPTVIRAMLLNVGMLAFYDQAKDFMQSSIGPGKLANFSASAIAGFFAAFLSLPADFLKTRLQKMQPQADGKMPYRGILHCGSRVLATEGPLAFQKGFPTFYFRIAPHAMITLLTLEIFNTLYKNRFSQ